MSGLLDGVLPWIFSQGNMAKKSIKGLLSDPSGFVGGIKQDFDTFSDQDAALSYKQGLLFPQDPRYASIAKSDPAFIDKQAELAKQRWQDFALNAITVYHGTPHKFSKFDSSKIGTGEGAQAYGHGLYFADQPGVAKTYAEMQIDEDKAFRAATNAAWDYLKKSSPFTDDAITWGPLRSKITKDQFVEVYKKNPDAVWEKLSPQARTAVKQALSGNLYKVDLPDDMAAKMLDWDKPLSQQAEAVRVAAMDLGLPSNATGKDFYNALANHRRDMAIIRGNNAKTTLPEMQSAASDELRGFGIPGIRYLDAGSRGAGKGSYNYVVFPGGESQLKILERNGKGLLDR